MNSFDPLDLFSPGGIGSESESDSEHRTLFQKSEKNLTDDFCPDDNESLEDSCEIIEVLDFPPISRNPPYDSLVFLLSLLAPDPTYNFVGPIEDENKLMGIQNSDIELLEYLNDRSLTVDQAKDFVKWVQDMYNSGKIASRKLCKLTNLLKVSQACKSDSVGFFTYVTSIISSSLSWIDDKDDQEKIWKLASLRLAENCGRTAQPGFIRRIVIDKNDQDSIYNVKLKEPSLTEDKLGLKTWGSSLALSSRLVSNYCDKQDNNIINYLRQPLLELGSGTGLVGIVCAILQKENKLVDMDFGKSKGIYLTDLPEIVGNLQENVNLNGVSDICEVYPLDWKSPASFNAKMSSDYGFVEGETNVFNTLIFSDPMYSADHPYLILDMIKLYLNIKNHGNVIIELPARPKYQNERNLLWTLIAKDPLLGQSLKLINDELEDGEDDFGKQTLIFKNWCS